jgi:hypothetical protein
VSNTGYCRECGLKILFPCHNGKCKPIVPWYVSFRTGWARFRKAYIEDNNSRSDYVRPEWVHALHQALDDGLLAEDDGYVLISDTGVNMNPYRPLVGPLFFTLQMHGRS